MADQVADLPPRSGDFRFLLINSYSESWQLRCGRPGGRSTSQNGNFRFPLIDSYTESSDLAYQVEYLTLPKWQFLIPTDKFLLWGLRFGRPGGRSTPQLTIWDSYWYIHIMRAQIWQTRWQITPQNGNFRFLLIDSYSESTAVADLAPFQWQFYSMRAHIWFLLWQLRCGRPGSRSTSQKWWF